MAFSFANFYEQNRRVLIWIVFFLILWMVRGFFGLIFLGFVFAFLATPLSRLIQRRARLPRRLAISLVYFSFLLTLVCVVTFVVPQVVREIGFLIGNLPDLELKIVATKNDLVRKYPPLDRAVLDYLTTHVREGGKDNAAASEHAAEFTRQMDELRTSMTLIGSDAAGTLSHPTVENKIKLEEYLAKRDELLLTAYLAQQLDGVRARAPIIVAAIWEYSVTLMLALFFSYLISMDIYRLGEELHGLKDSRLADLYNQTAFPVWRFAYVVGRAIYAQAIIACANTVLTIIGLYLLGIPSLVMLSFIVFLCSFVPVLGVFISTAPIVAVALNSGGFTPAIGAVGMVMFIHATEAYLLDPLVYGKHFKLNPVVVLLILFIGYHAFGIWGMILGVPVTYYFLHDVFGVKVWDERRLSPAEGAPRALAAMARTEAARSSSSATPSPAAVIAGGHADAAIVPAEPTPPPAI